MQDNIIERATSWIIGHDTGVSSKTIWAVMMNAIKFPTEKLEGIYCDIPQDPSDFGRCYRLLKLIPEWKKDLNRVSDIFPRWKYFVENWDKMESLYIEELPTGTCPKLYDFMREYIKKAQTNI